MRRLRIQQCMKFKKFQAHKPQWPRLSRLDIYYLPVWPEMKLWPLSSSKKLSHAHSEREIERERERKGDGIADIPSLLVCGRRRRRRHLHARLAI